MGGNQEERSDFNPAGEARGYISLDQARSLALQHARDNREFYGRYAEQELSWDIISAYETENYYQVRLSYHPQGNFRTAGAEQFNIVKTGEIESRHIRRAVCYGDPRQHQCHHQRLGCSPDALGHHGLDHTGIPGPSRLTQWRSYDRPGRGNS